MVMKLSTGGVHRDVMLAIMVITRDGVRVRRWRLVGPGCGGRDGNKDAVSLFVCVCVRDI